MVDGVVNVVRPITQIVRMDFHKTLVLRLAQQTEVQHFEVFREYGDDINLHNVPE